MNEERESIWSVQKKVKTAYYLGFMLFMVIGAIGVIQAMPPPAGMRPFESVRLFLTEMAPVTIGSAGLSLLVVELWNLGGFIMVLGAWLKDKVREQQRKELADRIDKLYGEGTYARLEEEKNQSSEGSNGNAGRGQRT